MSFSCIISATISVILIVLPYVQVPAPRKAATPADRSRPVEREDQERIKTFTEEVILPIVAQNAYGHFDPTVVPGDVLVLEDGVPQQVTSIRRIPVNLVLLIDMGTELISTQHLDVTRRIILRVISQLRSGDRALLIQFTNRAEVLQEWTEDKAKIERVVDPKHGKLLSGNRSRLSEGIVATANELDGKAAGSTHVVLITDGDDIPDSEYADALKRLLDERPTLHVLSYTKLVGQEAKKRNSALNFDPKIKRFYKNYDRSLRASEERLTAVAESFGAQISLPASVEEALSDGDEIAGAIDTRCVLTYIPKRPLESANDARPRHIEVFSRRVGLRVKALRTTLGRTSGSP